MKRCIDQLMLVHQYVLSRSLNKMSKLDYIIVAYVGKIIKCESLEFW